MPDGLSNLEKLYLGHNRLPETEVTDDLSEDLNSLKSLHLSKNPGYPLRLNLGEGVVIF